ncbi:VIT1/CCC1 transporter family protein [Terrimonas sp. NA20]|uniref:VIT1/CCC1 transporter family protein n=1 Tax=Terrimonas ginsenosidimutans TaxID=2908004 RepID=A0ABS9KXJ0_9BACT|nr:VIT1/CCC1 transporter family protein [Terrimonas ginsenosidimutans]MCG2617099.1 VIT1/CCC1 transporter family protein [Terrimonas ginsenosidimutans]
MPRLRGTAGMDQSFHQEKHLRNSDFLTDVVIGMSDGLTVPFALAAGLSGAVSGTSVIVIAGIAEIAAGSIAMGLGGYLAGKTEMEHYDAELKREKEEVETVPEKEKEEVKDFFANIGLSEEMQTKAADEIAKDKKQWVDFMMKYELGLEKPDPRRAKKAALNIGLSYAAGGLVPLSPYFFTDTPLLALQVSAVITLISLFVFGFLKSRITGVNPWQGAIRVTIIGAMAAAAAFGVAKLFTA